MTATWDKTKIATLLSAFFAPNLTQPKKNKSPGDSAPTATIDVLITFDAGGISSHPNHISLYHGARHFISQLIHNRPGWASPVNLYTLTTVNIVRKYSGWADSALSFLGMSLSKRGKGVDRDKVPRLVFLSGPKEYQIAWKAMTAAHVSQMKWFRYGWISLSRYMTVNDLQLEDLKGK